MVKKLLQKLSSKMLKRAAKPVEEPVPAQKREESAPRGEGQDGKPRRRRKRGGRRRRRPDRQPQAAEGGKPDPVETVRPGRPLVEEWRPGDGRTRPEDGRERPMRDDRPPRDDRRNRREEPRPVREAARPPDEERRAPVVEKKQQDAKRWSIADFQVEPKEGEARFHDFDLPDEIMHAVHDLGFRYCTPIQRKVLGYATQNKNIAGRAQTGTGKTAAFLICILARFLKEGGQRRGPGAPLALVIAPTRELVLQISKDAADLSRHCDFNCMAVYGGIDFEKQRRELKERRVDLIAATPGRLLDFKGRGVLDLKQLDVLVIDEADRMLDMGFIPDVRKIIRATPPKDSRQTMLFSATLTEDVLRLASQWMPDPVICEVDPEHVTVDTVQQVVYTITAREKFPLLYNLLQQKEVSRVLLFGNRRDTTQRLADNLRRHGIDCEYLSGAVRQDKRQKVLEGFRAGKIKIVVATDVAGRGLHVDNISHVINYDFPYEPEDYVHRIGRTGRAGVAGTAISFACEDESFVIPEIEEYIGEPLKCTVPDQELLEAPPAPTGPRMPERERSRPPRRGGGRRGSRDGGRGGSRGRR